MNKTIKISNEKLIKDTGLLETNSSDPSKSINPVVRHASEEFINLIKYEVKADFDINLQGEFFYPTTWLKRPYLSYEKHKAFNATLFQACALYCQEYIERNIQYKLPNVTANYSFHTNTDGTRYPVNLNSVFNAAFYSFREAAVHKFLITKSLRCKSIYDDYLLVRAVSQNFSFNYSPSDKTLDVIFPAEFFISICCAFGESLPELFFKEITRSPLYANILNAIVALKKHLQFDSFSSNDLSRLIEDIEDASYEITDSIDKSRIREENSQIIRNAGPSLPFANTSGSGFNMINNLSSVKSEGKLVERWIPPLASKVIVEYLSALPNKPELLAIKREIASYVNELNEQVKKLITPSNLETEISNENFGKLNPSKLYKLKGGDARIFDYSENKICYINKFNVFVLIDNSGSVGESKIFVIKRILCCMIEMLINFPEQFDHITAYAHEGSGGKITMRELLNASSSTLKRSPGELSKILHLHSMSCNYDHIALWEMLYMNQKLLRQNTSTKQLVFMFGDYGSSGATQTAEKEGELIMGDLRTKYPGLIIINIAVDSPSEETLYDFFINVKSVDFKMRDFTTKFKEIISLIIKKDEKNKRTNIS